MAISITVYPELSPRIIEILSPTTTASLQDVVNAIRAWEDTTIGLNYPFLINASGKEDLGGGVSVGITAQLQNAQIAFQQRGVSDDTGSVTTGSALGKTFIDTAATFITDSIVAGDSIYNITDGSMTTILSVVSETELITFALQGGADNQWDVLDNYRVWNKIQCEINGGNLVAVDEFGASMSAFLPTAETHVVRTSSASATLQNQAQLEFGTFLGGIAVNPATGTSGTLFPQGTREAPVDNFSDAHVISNVRGLRTIFILGDATITGVDMSANVHILKGDSPSFVLTVDPSADVTSSAMENLTVTGELDGLNTIRDCSLQAVTALSGFVEKTAFQSTLSLNGTTFMAECYSQITGIGYPVITTGANVLMVRDYHGSLGVAGMTGGVNTIEIYGGRLTIEASCVGGTIYVRGSHSDTINDLSGGAVTIIDQTTNVSIANAVWDKDISAYVTPGEAGFELLIARIKAALASTSA